VYLTSVRRNPRWDLEQFRIHKRVSQYARVSMAARRLWSWCPSEQSDHTSLGRRAQAATRATQGSGPSTGLPTRLDGDPVPSRTRACPLDPHGGPCRRRPPAFRSRPADAARPPLALGRRGRAGTGASRSPAGPGLAAAHRQAGGRLSPDAGASRQAAPAGAALDAVEKF